jgi:hypothetical protein
LITIGFIVSLASFGCNSSSNKKANRVPENSISKNAPLETPTSVSEPRLNGIADTLSRKIITQLNRSLKMNEADSIRLFLNGYAYIQTDQDFEKQWEKGKTLLNWLCERLNKRQPDGYQTMEKLSFLDNVFGLRSSCEAECTVFIFQFQLADLKKLAAYTSGKSDDGFLELLEQAHGEYITYNKGWLNFFERTWDYGGGSLLGDSLHCNFTFLKKSKAYMQQYSSYQKDLSALRVHVIQDMGHPIYMAKKEQVIGELRQILKSKVLFPKEDKEVKKILTSLENDNSTIQFNCADPESNCDWGG